MSQIITAIAILAITVMPAFAADLATQGADRGGAQKKMSNPQHLIMKAYHRNVANFGHTLYQAAEQGSTVPSQLARVAVAEMRRSTEEMEKYRATAMKDMQVAPQMQKMMDQHLVQLKTHLRELDELAKKERIDSAEVIKHLQSIFEGCEGAGCGMMPGGHGHGAVGDGRRGRAGGGCGCSQMMPQRGRMMDDMVRKMKGEDAELEGLVQEIQAAPRDRKLGLVSEVVARMVRQRAAMTQEMERMQRHMEQLPPMEPGMMPGTDDGDEEDDQDMDMDMDMEMDRDHP